MSFRLVFSKKNFKTKMWKINQSYVNKVKETLTELGGICPRCILRCAGMKNSKIIREAGLEETSEEKLEPDTKKVKLNPCRLCIGLLEERYMDSAFESVRFFRKKFQKFFFPEFGKKK